MKCNNPSIHHTPMYVCMYVCMSDTHQKEKGGEVSVKEVGEVERRRETQSKRRREALCRVCQGEWRELEGKK